MSHRLLEFGRIMVTRDSSRKRHAPTPTPLHLAGAWGRHRLAHGLVNGRSSITHKQTETACIIVACMISAAPLVSTVTCYGSSKNFPSSVSVETPPWICLYGSHFLPIHGLSPVISGTHILYVSTRAPIAGTHASDCLRYHMIWYHALISVCTKCTVCQTCVRALHAKCCSRVIVNTMPFNC